MSPGWIPALAATPPGATETMPTPAGWPAASATVCAVMPSEARPESVTLPVAISCAAMLVTVSDGIAKPIPADTVPSILATLRRDGVPATFFLTGNFVRDFPAAARSIAAAGCRIGDHTITHPYLTGLSDTAVRQEILGAAQQIIAVTGQGPAPLFRFPYGDADARTIAVANRAGYVPVRWTVDTLGWEGTAGHISAPVVVSWVLAAAQPGEIVLMHVGSNPDDHTTFDADALPR
jgi:peptidoglycan/xylan/chitin deacetylase (PgdA/CDA1 family)